MLKLKTSGYDSPSTTLRALEEDPNVGQEAAQGSVMQKEWDLDLAMSA